MKYDIVWCRSWYRGFDKVWFCNSIVYFVEGLYWYNQHSMAMGYSKKHPHLGDVNLSQNNHSVYGVNG
jgi:hypothetical protein